jgi:hypothetical protein
MVLCGVKNGRILTGLKATSFANVDPKLALDVYLKPFNVAVFVMNP